MIPILKVEDQKLDFHCSNTALKGYVVQADTCLHVSLPNLLKSKLGNGD